MQGFVGFKRMLSGADDVATFKGTWEALVFRVGFFMFCQMTVCSIRIPTFLTNKWPLILVQI